MSSPGLYPLLSIAFMIKLSASSALERDGAKPPSSPTVVDIFLLARIFFNERKISVSQETINIISQKAMGDRKNLNNELNKIENFLGSKRQLNIDDALKLTNLSENYSIKDLVNNCLAKNKKIH